MIDLKSEAIADLRADLQARKAALKPRQFVVLRWRGYGYQVHMLCKDDYFATEAEARLASLDYLHDMKRPQVAEVVDNELFSEG